MRFAFLPSPLPSHVYPTLGVAEELIARGHRVDYHLPEELGQQARALGAALRPYRLTPGSSRPLADDPVTRFAMIPFWLTAECGHVLPQVLDQVGREPPDVVVYDMLCVWGRLLARLTPGPAALVVGSYVGNQHWSPTRTAHYQTMAPRLAEAFSGFAADVDRLGRRYGLAIEPRDLFARDEQLVVVFMPRSFHPAGETFDGRFAFVGACIRPGDQGLDGDAALLAALDRGRPIVYVSFGTVVEIWPELIADCYRAFGDGRWQVVMALGDRAAPPGAPDSFLIRRRVPQIELLRRTDVLVTHGGTNSVMEALHLGVPMVVIAQAPEHAITADRVAELGLGVRLDPAAITAAGLRAAVDRVAVSEEIRGAVGRMRAATRAAGGALAAADALERLARV